MLLLACMHAGMLAAFSVELVDIFAVAFRPGRLVSESPSTRASAIDCCTKRSLAAGSLAHKTSQIVVPIAESKEINKEQ